VSFIFFSTKKACAGLGLGIAKKIVEAHGGEIIFSPNREKGVTFDVCFPI
jgi:signal transduction histidine kinase